VIIALIDVMIEPRVAIIVSNYNGVTIQYGRKNVLDICLQSLRKTSYKNYKVVFVDDCSSDNSVEYIKKKFPNVSILKNKANVGFARSNNGGIVFVLKRYNPSYVLLLNNDIAITDAEWLKKMVDVAESDKNIGIVGCKLVYPDGRIQHAGAFGGVRPHHRGRTENDMGQYEGIEDVEAVTGAVFLIKRALIKRIGLLDGNFFMGYEDLDYCIRARNAGFRIIYDGNVKLSHLERATLDNTKRFFTEQRNCAYFAMKHFGIADKMMAISFAIVGGMVTIENKDRVRRLRNIRLKDRPLWRLATTIRAAYDGYVLYRRNKTYRNNHFVVVRAI
jgi:GT2 family glycosyltransferase